MNYLNREIRNILDNVLSKELIREDNKGKSSLKNALQNDNMERDTAEFSHVKTILKSLKLAEMNYEEGKVLYAINRKEEGDWLFVVKTTTLESTSLK